LRKDFAPAQQNRARGYRGITSSVPEPRSGSGEKRRDGQKGEKFHGLRGHEPGAAVPHTMKRGDFMKQKEIKIVSRIRIDGKYYNIQDLPKEQVDKIIEERIDMAMAGIGYERVRKPG